MKILFAPSEGKRNGGTFPSLNADSLIFPEFYTKRLEIIEQYQKFIQNADDEELIKLFGIKDIREFERYKVHFESTPTMKAIERYDGVAYDYLRYASLSKKSQAYIDAHTIVFSNLFGPVQAGDYIPDYKLKQGSAIGGVVPEKFYKEHFTNLLDDLIGEEEILDLRAGFYDKFYTPKNQITTLKFLKEGKAVSHWAKAYRGVVLRTVSVHQIQSIEEFLGLNIDGLLLEEIIKNKQKKEVVYSII